MEYSNLAIAILLLFLNCLTAKLLNPAKLLKIDVNAFVTLVFNSMYKDEDALFNDELNSLVVAISKHEIREVSRRKQKYII